MTWDWLPLALTQVSSGPDPGDPGIWTIRVVALALSVVALALVGYQTFGRRGRRLGPEGRWLLMIGFLVVSPLVYVLNLGLAVSGAKSVAFCSSCHVMSGFVEDLQNPDSEHLASLHYQFRWIAEHQCYTCHSDYGLFGDVQAKFAGLRHVWFNYLGGYELPLKIRGTYDNRRCLFCHGPAKSYREVPEHQKNESAIASSETSCVAAKCHVSPHPESAARVESAHES